ncbi:MAG: tyrosine--tRNA ligase [Candidatus Woesearchaeota archaeon]
MNIDERLALIKQVGEEIITEKELRALLEKKKSPVAYDGFEPSGRIHIAQGLLRAINVNKMLKAGCEFIMWVADWHAWANNKFGGDLDKIQTAGKYFVEVWKACGMDVNKVKFTWCSDFANNSEYWKKVMQIARNNTVSRIVRCSQIMGRKESESLSAAQIFYPVMQAADIFQLNIDICQLGMDQRKVNMLAREIAPKLGYKVPVAVHHHMLMGLQQPPASAEKDAIERALAMKMSKSNPESAVFMDDTTKDVERKIGNAYCPAKQLHENPIIEYCKYIIFEKQKELVIERPEKFGGKLILNGFEELSKEYSTGKLHPQDLKKAVASAIDSYLEPVRKHFSRGKPKELLEQVKSFDVTR